MMPAFAAEYGAELIAPFRGTLGGDVDDAAPAARGHRRVNRLGHEEHALQVDADDAVEVGLGVVGKRLADVHTGVVEQDIDGSEFRRGVLGEGPGRGDVSDVDRAVQGATAVGANFRGSRIGLGVVVQVAERNVRTVLREQQCGRSANAAGSAGY
jgi:hypothetical protein